MAVWLLVLIMGGIEIEATTPTTLDKCIYDSKVWTGVESYCVNLEDKRRVYNYD